MFPYLVAVLAVAAAAGAGLLVDRFLQSAPFVSLFLCAILLAAWVGGLGPGLLATGLSILAFDHFFISPLHSFGFGLDGGLRIALFTIAALFVVWVSVAQKRTAESLRRARDDLRATVADLRRSDTYLAEAQRLSNTGSFGWKLGTDEIFWSKETHRIMGFDETVSPTISLLLQRVHPDDREFVQRQLDRALQGEQYFDYEYRLRMPDGAIKHIHVRAHRQAYEAGGEELVGALMDVTATKQAQEALQTAQTALAHVTRVTMLGEMTTSIAHEVNQPLGAIVTNAGASLRWLDRQPPDIEEVRAAIGQIVNDAHRANQVIRRIREFAKKADPEMSRLYINEVVKEGAILLRPEALRHGVTIRLQLASDLLPVRGDKVQLQQVMLNLLVNGMEAMATVRDRARVLTVRTQSHQADSVLVAIEDAGVGIKAENADRLFSAFYTTKPDGLGMGLSIVRSIIEAHGGRVWALPNAGPGMTFQFTVSADGQHERRSAQR
ncbi:MAG TPA: ATP-binding protein [Xanthobacteraceae bacterium]|nr:ATP-binding protein [Xanthobacteraceae bacterium]